MSPRWQKIAVPFVLLLIVIAFFWKLLLTNQYSWLQSPDLAFQVLPWFQYEATQFHHHVFPLWDPFQFAGQSLIGQDQPGLAYPLNWILFSLPLRDGHINIHYLNWYYMSIHCFGALFVSGCAVIWGASRSSQIKKRYFVDRTAWLDCSRCSADPRRGRLQTSFCRTRPSISDREPSPMQPCRISETTATVAMKCRGMVVMSENNAPGWVALVAASL